MTDPAGLSGAVPTVTLRDHGAAAPAERDGGGAIPAPARMGDQLMVARLHLRQSQVLQAENAAAFHTPGRAMPVYSYRLGPDGQAYVVGGSVPLYASPVFVGGAELRGVATVAASPAPVPAAGTALDLEV
jgi:hypothetical protein